MKRFVYPLDHLCMHQRARVSPFQHHCVRPFISTRFLSFPRALPLRNFRQRFVRFERLNPSIKSASRACIHNHFRQREAYIHEPRSSPRRNVFLSISNKFGCLAVNWKTSLRLIYQKQCPVMQWKTWSAFWQKNNNRENENNLNCLTTNWIVGQHFNNNASAFKTWINRLDRLASALQMFWKRGQNAEWVYFLKVKYQSNSSIQDDIMELWSVDQFRLLIFCCDDHA